MLTTTPATDTAVDLTFASQPYVPPACDGPSHPKGVHGHEVRERARWLVVFPCGAAYHMCDSWVQRLVSHSPDHPYNCRAKCGVQHVAGEVHYHQLD